MKITNFLTVCATLFMMAACTSKKDRLVEQITALEHALYGDSTLVPDTVKAGEIINLYIQFAEEFPDDTLSGSYLFKAGDISSKMNRSHQAIELFSRMIQKYPNHPNTPYAVFLQGFIYENQMGDPVKARPYYETFLRSYPDHPIAADVSFSLENLGKSPEELIRQFESRLHGDSTVFTDTTNVSIR